MAFGENPKEYKWARFLNWLNTADDKTIAKFHTPTKPSKSPLAGILTEFAGAAQARDYVAAMYKARWVQTRDLITTNTEKFVKFWQASEYGTKPAEGFHLKQQELEWVVDQL